MAASSVFTIDETHYFTVDDLARGFAPIVGSHRARELTLAWSEEFADCIERGRVVALPPSYDVKRFGARRTQCEPTFDIMHAAELESLHGRRLLNFTPATLTLVAAANPDVRKRFDRLKIPYGWATIDDPVKWRQLIEFLKNP